MSTIKLTLAYEDTDFTRQIIINDVADTDAALETVRAKAKAVNESLAGGTDDGLSTFFRADDGSKLAAIKSCNVIHEDDVILI